MKYLTIGGLALLLNLFGCHQTKKHVSFKKNNDIVGKDTLALQTAKNDSGGDKDKIQLLMRNMLLWAESGKAPDLTPVIVDSKDSLCIGFDDEKVKANLLTLKSTGYFSTEFIDNYNHILQALGEEMKDKKFAPWSTGELPPFNFANDVDPWSDCQDVPYDKPNAYSLVEVHIVKLNKEEGELYWTWKKLKPDNDPTWNEFKYKFKVKKEDDQWKISYLEGFNFEQGVKYVS